MNKMNFEIKGETFWIDLDEYDRMIEFKKNPYAYREKYKQEMEENKYYTPEIEEFNTEFEYEWLDENKVWNKATPTEITFKDFNEQKYGLRVKCLDKQDIEELGWIVKEESDFSITFFLTKTRLLNRYKLVFEKDSNRTKSMSIYELGGISYIPIFIGTIKNKSELKKLMKQSNII